MTERATPLTSQQRAELAAEELAAEGGPVTARTVRQRARVDMTVAAAVARAWKEREAATAAVPPIPDIVQTRVEALWREAVGAAREEHAADREGWEWRLRTAEEHFEEVSKEAARDVQNAESERDQAREAARADGEKLRARIAELEEAIEKSTAAAAAAAEQAKAAEARASTAEGIADGLREALESLSPKGK